MESAPSSPARLRTFLQIFSPVFAFSFGVYSRSSADVARRGAASPSPPVSYFVRSRFFVEDPKRPSRVTSRAASPSKVDATAMPSLFKKSRMLSYVHRVQSSYRIRRGPHRRDETKTGSRPNPTHHCRSKQAEHHCRSKQANGVREQKNRGKFGNNYISADSKSKRQSPSGKGTVPRDKGQGAVPRDKGQKGSNR